MKNERQKRNLKQKTIGLKWLQLLPSILLYLSSHILLILYELLFYYSNEIIKELPFEIKLPEVADKPSQITFNPCSKTEIRAIVKEFPKHREDFPVFLEEFRIIIGVYEPELSDHYELVHLLVEPGEVQKSMQEEKWQNHKDDFYYLWHPTFSPQESGKAHKITTDPLQAIPRIFLAHTDWSII